MKGKTALILGILGVSEIIYFLIYLPPTETVFGIALNGWLFFAIWFFITGFAIYSFIKENS